MEAAMVRRSVRSLHPSTAAEMRAETLAFQTKVRTWAGSIPINTPSMVALEALNDVADLTARCLQAVVDGRRQSTGRAGIDDFD